MTYITLVKDCGLYPTYKKIIDFTGTKEQIVQKQKTWLDGFDTITFTDVNYNKFNNAVTLDIDYSDALQYSYAMLENVVGSDDNRVYFCFITGIENKSSGNDPQENGITGVVSINLAIDPIMTFMGEYDLDECMVNREHSDRWTKNSYKPARITPNQEKIDCYMLPDGAEEIAPFDKALVIFTYTADNNANVGVRETTDIKCAVYPIDIKSPYDTIYGYININDANNSEVSGSDVTTMAVPYPSYNDTLNARFTTMFALAPNDIISVNIVPLTEDVFDDIFNTITAPDKNGTTKTCYYFDALSLGSGHPTIHFYDCVLQGDGTGINGYEKFKVSKTVATSNSYEDSFSEKTTAWVKVDETLHYANEKQYPAFMMQLIEFSDTYGINYSVSLEPFNNPLTKPTNNAYADAKYEPALYMYPYRTRCITDGYGETVLEIPDMIWFNDSSDVEGVTLKVNIMCSGYGVAVNYVVGTYNITVSGRIGCATNKNASTVDIINDKWLEYVVTERDTDRQMVVNNSVKSAIDNLLFMGYGGALVGSRSSSGKQNIETVSGTVRTHNIDNRTGKAYYINEPYSYKQISKYGMRMLSAVGMATGASLVSAVVDSHFAWQDQMAKEQAVRNQPSGLLSIGSSSTLIQQGVLSDKFVCLKCDTVNYETAYDNYRMYGHIINRFKVPNIYTRKYFNYVLTNNCIVKGSLNQDIRDAIASVFDNGVTIFHYDSGETETRNLEYTSKENIEVALL